MSDPFAPKSRPWLSHGVAGLLVFAVTSLVISSAVRRQTAILDAMDLQPLSAAATLAYAWGSAEDARQLLGELAVMAERGSHSAPQERSGRDPDFALLRRMDADMAKLRLALLEGAPREKLQDICAKATIRCTPYTLEGLITMLKKQRHVP